MKIEPPPLTDEDLKAANEFEKLTEVGAKKEKEDSDIDQIGFMDDTSIQPKPKGLNNSEIASVRQSWAFLKEKYGEEKIGIILFKQIFKIAPEALELFPFKNEPNYLNSDSFKKHVTKVAQAVSKAVDLLDDLGTLAPILKKLGKDHVKKSVKAEHYPIVG